MQRIVANVARTSQPSAMLDSPELAAQKLLDMLPAGCDLETTVKPDGLEWKATARVEHPDDSPRPRYVGHGPTEEAALLRAIGACAGYWAGRNRHGSSVISGWRENGDYGL